MLILVLLATACFSSAAEIKVNGHTFTLPAGFEIELIAGPGLVDRPITCDFDDEGNLYVTDSSGTNDNIIKQQQDRPHRIVKLQDVDGDGKFDKQTVFADKLSFPEGTLWYDGSLYVAAPPSIWKFTDTNGDGLAEERSEWFQGKTVTGCANDLHGPYLGRDGWIYWCKGAFAKQTYERPGQAPFVTRASHIFRCRPDGSGLEHVMTGGMDNPVDAVSSLGGERFFTTTFLQNPGGGKRDGLIHAVYGGVYGKVHDVIEDHIRTGDVLPVLSHMGPAAPCGLAVYDSAVFGTEFEGNLFACSFNLHKVLRHELTETGATYSAKDSDFLVSSHLDFHPTDIHEDADGSLVVVDTGGWYKLCCPTSQLWKPDILGGIYRVRRSGAPKLDDARGSKLKWNGATPEELCTRLADARPAVQRRAMHELGKLGAAAVPALKQILESAVDAKLTRLRANAVWAMTRIAGEDARLAVQLALKKTSSPACLAALNSISLWRDATSAPAVKNLLKTSKSLVEQRLAVEILGRLGDKSAAADLLALAPTADDRMLEHAVMYALISLNDRDAASSLLSSDTPRAVRIGLIALSQMPAGQLDPKQVVALLDRAEPIVQESAFWIVDRHPEWADAVGEFFKRRLEATEFSEASRAELTRLLSRFAKAASMQALLAEAVLKPESSIPARKIALEAMSRAGLKELPAIWLPALLPILKQPDSPAIAEAVAVARSAPAPKDQVATLSAALLQVGRDDRPSVIVRVSALAAVAAVGEIDGVLFDLLVKSVGVDQDVSLRAASADVLGRAKLSAPQLATVTELLKIAGPLEAGRMLEGFKESTDEGVGLKLVAVLKDAPALSSLRVDILKLALGKFPAPVQLVARDLYASLNADPEKQKARLDSLLTAMKPGDIRRGQAVFHSQKAACAACHQMGYVGGNVGPDLTRIGQIRTERDLLEAIVFPSSSFVRSYEPVVVALKTGKTHSGLVRVDSLAELVLATGPKEEVRLTRDEIEEIRPGTLSVMPSGLDQQLSPQELADLIAFLKGANK